MLSFECIDLGMVFLDGFHVLIRTGPLGVCREAFKSPSVMLLYCIVSFPHRT